MNFRDQSLTCTVCGKMFIFTVTEQRKLYEEAMEGAGDSAAAMPTGAGESIEIVSPTRCPDCRLQDPETGRWFGRIKWFRPEKGYGFIVKPNEDEIFFHRSQVIDESSVSLEQGTPVTFDQIMTDKGAEAQQVKVEVE